MPAVVGYAVASDVVPATGGTYVEAVIGTPRYLNPLLAEPGSPDDDVCALVFSGLTRAAPDGTITPDLALGWAVSPNGLQYSFRLRSDVQWHDGHPFGADDVVATVRALQAPDFPGDPALAMLWKGIDVAPTDEGVRFTLPAPDSGFPEQASIGIIPAEVARAVRGRALLESEFNMRPVGTGPFRVAAAELRRIQLTAAEGYVDRTPYVQGIELRFVGTADAALAALKRGEVTAVRPLPAHDAANLPPGAVAYVRPERSKTVMLLFNTRVAPLDDAATRAAVARAIDRVRAADVLGDAVEPVAAARADVAAAADTLDRAGWKPGADGTRQRDGKPLRFAIVTNDRPERVTLAEELARQLGQIGARVEVEKVGWAGLVGDVLAADRFQAALLETFEPAADPDPGRLWGRGSPFNVGGWSSQRGDELLAQARRATTSAARAQALRDWRAVFDAEAPAVRLLHPALIYPVAVELRGQSVPALVLPRDRFATLADWFLFTRRAPGRF